MDKIKQLFANNYSWAQRMKEENSTYFRELAAQIAEFQPKN